MLKQKFSSIVIAVLVLFFACMATSASSLNKPSSSKDSSTTPVIISLKVSKDATDPNVSKSKKQNEIENTQKQVIERHNDDLNKSRTTEYENIPAIATEIETNKIDDLKNDPSVVSVQHNHFRFTKLDDSVGIIGADKAFDLGFDGSGTAVAILDTGVDTSHSFVNVISEACYSNAGGSAGGTELCPGGASSSTAAGSGDNCNTAITEDCNHGTHVGGIAAGTGSGQSFSGVAKGAGIISVQIFTRYDGATCTVNVGYTPCVLTNDSDIISGLDHVLELQNDSGFTTPIATVNLSLGGDTTYNNQSTCDSDNSATKTAIDSLKSAGIATVVASGNESSSSGISAPACISSAVAVGATTKSDVVASYSNSGSLLDLLAPGSSIYSSVVGDGNFDTYSGTSMAAPHVSGAWAIAKQFAPNSTVDEVLQALQNTGKSITDSRNNLSFSRVNIGNALTSSDGLADDYMWYGTDTVGQFTDQSISVSSPNYTPISGDFDGDGKSDIFWYGPGSAGDYLWFGTNTLGQFSGKSINVKGVYTPISGDFNNDGYSDIFWYGSGPKSDYMWYGTNTRGQFNGKSIDVKGTYTPLSGDFDGDGKSDIFWYGSGPKSDYMWYGTSNLGRFSSKSINVKGVYTPLVNDFNGDNFSDIFWYGPGAAGDYLWSGTNTKGSFTGSQVSVSGVFSPVTGDFNGDNFSDIFWYGPGAAGDYLWSGTNTKGSFEASSSNINGTYLPIDGNFNGDTYDDIFWYGN